MVLVLGNYLKDGGGSMQNMASLLMQSLREKEIPAKLIIPPCVAGICKACDRGVGKWLGYLDKLVIFPCLLKRGLKEAKKIDPKAVVHICDHSNALYTRFIEDIPCVVTCHDLLAVRSAMGEFPQNPTRWSGKRLQAMILGGLNRSTHVVCVSEATRRDVLRLSTIEEDRTSVVPNALHYPYSPMPSDQARERIQRLISPGDGLPEPFANGFILHVGGNQWYKNRMGVLRIYALLAASHPTELPVLVMAGQPFTEEMHSYILAQGLSDRVFSLVHCGNEDLRTLYSAAHCLLFPSLAEGFGWPVIEAQACGCPVVCSSVAPFPEVSGGAALMCDPMDAEGFGEQVLRFREPAVRSRFIEMGFENASRHAPSEMADGYIRVYRSLQGN